MEQKINSGGSVNDFEKDQIEFLKKQSERFENQFKSDTKTDNTTFDTGSGIKKGFKKILGGAEKSEQKNPDNYSFNSLGDGFTQVSDMNYRNQELQFFAEAPTVKIGDKVNTDTISHMISGGAPDRNVASSGSSSSGSSGSSPQLMSTYTD